MENADFSDSEHYNLLTRGDRAKAFQERSTSLDATFVLEDKRLKLVRYVSCIFIQTATEKSEWFLGWAKSSFDQNLS